MKCPWHTLLDGSLYERAEQAIDDIARDLSRPFESWSINQRSDPAGLRTVSLASGRAGVALFFHYLAAARKSERLARVAAQYLDDAIDRVPHCVMPPSLYCGFTGVAWVSQEMDSNEESIDDAEPDDFESVLLECVDRSPWAGAYDLIDGLAGIGIYFLDRLPVGYARRAVDAIVQRLNETCIQQDGGITWPPSMLPNNRLPNESAVLGTAHGIPGVIAFLAATNAVDIQSTLTARLQLQALNWLREQEQPAPTEYVFPNIRGAERSRSAWCYGDPGIAGALLSTARVKGNLELAEYATNLAIKSTRRPLENTGVVDAGLCHGAVGLAHLYNRMYQATQRDELRAAAIDWIERTLAYRNPGMGVGGFSAWSYEQNPDGAWADDPCWLTGAAGVGLALLASIGSLDPEWDRIMALSI